MSIGSRRSSSLPIALPLAALLLGSTPIVFGQTESAVKAEAEKPAAKKDKAAEKIQVTGSRIKRTEVETSAPTVVYTREQIESSGVATAAELLRKSASSSTGNFDGNVGFVRGGSSTADLFGLGSGRTLVLLDGERLPRDASLSGTNLSLIPASLIERMEILSGSRSAVYGSDAIAGVINIITRKDLNGSSVKTSVRVPENGGGERLAVNAATGFAVGNARVILAANAEKENRILRTNRDISFGEGKYGYSTAYSPFGTYSYRLLDAKGAPTSNWTASSNCPAENIKDFNPPAGTGSDSLDRYCAGKIAGNSPSELLPAYEKKNLSSKIDYDLGSSSKISAFAMFTQNESLANQGATLTTLQNPVNNRYLMLSADQASQFIPELAPGQAAELRIVSFDAPKRSGKSTDKGYGGYVNFETELNAKTNLSVGVNSYVSDHTRLRKNVPDRDGLYNSLFAKDAKPSPLTLLSRGTIEQFADDLTAKELNRSTGASVNLSRSILELGGGSLTANFGVDVRKENFNQTPDLRDTQFMEARKTLPRYTGTEGIAGAGDRNISSAYAELSAPITKDFTFDAAARQDQYTDFGNASTYNLGAKYQVAQGFTVRSTAGTSFRAPDLNYIHQVGGGGYENITDQGRCDYLNKTGIRCDNPVFNIFIDRPGNPDMEAERGRSYTIGAILEPSSDLYLSFDYGGFAINNVFDRRSAADVANDYFAGKDIGASKVVLNEQGGYIDSAAIPWENIGQELTYLVQGEGAYALTLDKVRFNYRTNASRTLSRKSQQADGTLKQNNGIEGVPKWKWSNSITTSYDKLAWTLNSSTTAKQTPDPENSINYRDFYFNESVPEYTQYDTNIDWNFLPKSKATLGVLNIADKIGGKYLTGNYTGAVSSNSYLYASSWYGRTFYANLTQEF